MEARRLRLTFIFYLILAYFKFEVCQLVHIIYM
jgi:hypothetical protein